MAHEIWLTFPDGSEHELRERLTIGRDEANDLTLASKKVLRLVDALEESDDVQDVYANFDIPERVLESVAS